MSCNWNGPFWTFLQIIHVLRSWFLNMNVVRIPLTEDSWSPPRRLFYVCSRVRSRNLHSLQGPQVICMEGVLGIGWKRFYIKLSQILCPPLMHKTVPATLMLEPLRFLEGAIMIGRGMVWKGTSSDAFTTSQPVAPCLGSSCSMSLACESRPFCSIRAGGEAPERKRYVH